jgi:hypothetical protein
MESKETPEEAAKRFVESKKFRTEQKDKTRLYSFLQGYKQAEKHLYSEEDMKEYANYVSTYNRSNKWEFPLSPKDWFKQYKK